MPLSFPLSLADFFDRLPVASTSFDLSETSEASQTAGGEIMVDQIGERLWQGQVTLGRLTKQEVGDAKSLINIARGAGDRSFYIYDTDHAFPRHDPDGTDLGASTVQINALSSDARLISLKGLPANYTGLGRGTYLSFQYLASPQRQALHEIVELDVPVFGSGNSGGFEVNPPIRPGAIVDAQVQLIKPVCKAIMVPGSFQPGRKTRFITEGMSFSWLQTLR